MRRYQLNKLFYLEILYLTFVIDSLMLKQIQNVQLENYQFTRLEQ